MSYIDLVKWPARVLTSLLSRCSPPQATPGEYHGVFTPPLPPQHASRPLLQCVSPCHYPPTLHIILHPLYTSYCTLPRHLHYPFYTFRGGEVFPYRNIFLSDCEIGRML